MQYLNSPRSTNESGFTIIELLVSLTMSAIMFALITKTILFQSDTYINDIARLRIQQNLRGAMDLVSMNVRQAGEGLDAYFPALTLAQEHSPATSRLTIRRKIVSEVFTTCKPLVPGANQIYISDITSIESACFPSNVAPSVAIWSAYRLSKSGTVPIYIYNRVAKSGEFIDYRTESTSGGDYYLQTTSVTGNYPARSSSIYILEEYAFSLDQPNKTLQLSTNGVTDQPQDVAYKVSDFQIGLTMSDGSAKTTLDPTDVVSWKNIKAVSIAMTGVETWKAQTFTRTVTGSYFPRNVLSH